ncbi:hypothetical protein [Pseudomonas fluorescens]|uniref:Uncharacterized protein n=1 Tax=Pseudomonas fluorescens TaxID=294 RepID=A0A0F4TNC3_PSEFL|nr:hypothetical protein [Pseudomonas fluorescens]KJZ45559.1 hypothetical protein VC34_08470 [Pseudomonas fluorescens]
MKITIFQFIWAFFVYYALTYIVKLCVFKSMNLKPMPNYHWAEKKHFLFIAVPDLLWAVLFKAPIQNPKTEKSRSNHSKFVTLNNNTNLWCSIVLTVFAIGLTYSYPATELQQFISALVFVRFLSRSFEIFYAFLCDAIQSTTPSTSLTKTERIKLALKSYAEIYIYSASAYLVLPCTGIEKAATLSLNVGTLTNVGMAFTEPTHTENLIVFVQVLTTLCLVILSLASYISRSDKDEGRPG